MGGGNITITGSGSVMIGNNEAEIVSWTSSEIVAQSFATDVVVYVCNEGNANAMCASTPLM